MRTLLVGNADTLRALGAELARSGITRHTLIGRIVTDAEPVPRAFDRTVLGGVRELSQLVEQHRADLVLLGSEAPRREIFEALARGQSPPAVRLWDLSAFYEATFGHLPVAVIDATWLQYVLDPRFHPTPPRRKRCYDVAMSIFIGLPLLPVLLVLALIIRRDGGPALFRQERVGQGGRPFTMYKLRTMTCGEAAGHSTWCEKDDPRVTPVGRALRRAHLDELPQLLNVLKGEMSFIGPRPEQPHYVERLSAKVPFYALRHLVKPGLTGWAQVQCGYAGSDWAAAWKLSHDLYYVKRRSLTLDLKILWRTLGILLRDHQYADTDLPDLPFVITLDGRP